MSLRLAFMGSPEFALPSLQALSELYNVVGVVTQPDRPSGRGRVLTSPPIKILALELGIPVIQPERLREPPAVQQLRTWSPDLIIVAAFGQILRKEVLELPQFGCINIHASLLPRWRGAAPIQAAILNGDEQTGITIMRMDPGLDTGPVLSQRPEPILTDDTAGSLSRRLSRVGAELLLATLPDYISGRLKPIPQAEAGITSAPQLKKEDGHLDFSQPAADLARCVRAFNPWPGAFMIWKDQVLKIHRAHSADEPSSTPGKLTIHQSLPAVETSEGILVLDELQPAGKKNIPGKAFLQGARDWS